MDVHPRLTREAIQAAHRIDDVGALTPLHDQIWTEVKSGQ